ncbi:MAG: major capsid protein [Psychrobacter sp.]|nr:major capsid protein [Psychrobacter sp.]
MPLSNNSQYGVVPMTEAINKLPANPTIIRELGLFKPQCESTTSVAVESKNGVLTLVNAVPRGTPGDPVASNLGNRQVFEMLHLPKSDIVRADDVQNVKAFGGGNKAQTVAEKVNDKLADMKSDIEYTREHLMLGALSGKILNANGDPIVDIYDRFGLTRQTITWTLSATNSNVGSMIDSAVRNLSKKRGGEPVNGWIVLCSPEFMDAVIYHKTVVSIYERYQEGSTYRSGDTSVGFEHKNLKFINYDHVFDSGLQIKEGEAIILPAGTKSTFKEFFAPADMSATVNTKALPYYASREKLAHDKGWSLEAQSNPLPLLLRPELVATLKMT